MILKVGEKLTLLNDLDHGNKKWPMEGEVIEVREIRIDTDDMVPQVFVCLTTDRLDQSVVRPHFGPIHAYDFMFFFLEVSNGT